MWAIAVPATEDVEWLARMTGLDRWAVPEPNGWYDLSGPRLAGEGWAPLPEPSAEQMAADVLPPSFYRYEYPDCTHLSPYCGPAFEGGPLDGEHAHGEQANRWPFSLRWAGHPRWSGWYTKHERRSAGGWMYRWEPS